MQNLQKSLLCLALITSLIVANDAQQQQQQLPVDSQTKVSSNANQQQQQQVSLVSSTPTSAAQLQAHLSQIQQQAQRQLGQLNGLVLNAVNSTKYSNVIEAISSVGKAIHQQISAATNPNHVNFVASPGSGGLSESANSKKNEYQSIVITDQGSSLQTSSPSNGAQPSYSNPLQQGNLTSAQLSANYREQGELLRQEIVRRAGQLQQVVASSMDLLKNNGDLIVRRLLEQMNVRLDAAKAKADKIINEPTTNEVALRALGTINLGLNNLNNMIANIVNRLDLANKDAQQQQQQAQVQSNSLAAAPGAVASQQQQAAGGSIQQRILQSSPSTGQAQLSNSLPQIIDTNRFRANLHQLSQQFQQALNGSTLHQQLALIRNQRLQQQQQQQMLNLSTAQKVQN